MSRDPSNLAVTLTGVAVLTVITGVVWFGLGAEGTPPPSMPSDASQDRAVGSIQVHVSGAVAAPGVVELPLGAIVANAVAAAGGALGSADLTSINLAATLRSGERIVVPDLIRQVGG